jgi:ADP-ribose pyrophosphatase YjhB (NUDIX family)
MMSLSFGAGVWGQEMKRTESAGGIVVNAATGLILVVSQYGTSWSLPKGHIEAGEDRLTAARREIREESGVTQLDYVKDLGSYSRYKLSPAGGEDPTELKVIHMFLFKTAEETLRPLDPANPEARWVKKEMVAQLLTHPEDREFFLKATKDTLD